MNKIHSIVVLYNPTAENIANFKKIASISDKLILIDNSNAITSLIGYEKLNIQYIKNDENIGLSKALNLGIRNCLNNADCTHIALFDQDSVPDKNMFIELINELNKSNDAVVAVSPQILDVKNKNKQNKDETEIVDVVITSGSFYPKQAFEKVGLMDETLFIDYIDYEWCLRAKSKGYKIVRVNNAHLYHNMGDSFINFLGISKPVHTNKLRHYYIVRNQLIMLNRDYVSVEWKCIHAFKLFYRIPSYLILSNEKWTTFKFILKAVKEAFANRKEYKKIKY
jgi:rhamnosyltransferase